MHARTSARATREYTAYRECVRDALLLNVVVVVVVVCESLCLADCRKIFPFFLNARNTFENLIIKL